MWRHGPAAQPDRSGGSPAGTVAFVVGVRVSPVQLRKALDRIAPTLREAAAVLGVSEDSLSNWLAGRTHPHPATVARILDAARVQLSELVGGVAPGLAELRAAAGLTRTAAAKAAGISRARWAQFENGDRTPFPRDVRAIAAALSIEEDAVRDALAPVPLVLLALRMTQEDVDRFARIAAPDETTGEAVIRAALLGLGILEHDNHEHGNPR